MVCQPITDHFNVFALNTDFHPQCSLTVSEKTLYQLLDYIPLIIMRSRSVCLIITHDYFSLALFIIVVKPNFNTATTWKRYTATPTQHLNIHTFLDLMSVSSSLVHVMMQKSSLQGHISLQSTFQSFNLLLIIVMCKSILVYVGKWVHMTSCHTSQSITFIRSEITRIEQLRL